MFEIEIENYVPVLGKSFRETDDGSWTLDWKEGEWFKAIATSKNGTAMSEYMIYSTHETNLIQTKKLDGEWDAIKESIKPISQNEGTGIVRLSGGWVINRFGSFRRKKFQDFLDKFEITSIKNFNEYGFDTTFVIEDTATKSTRLLIPKGSKISIINKGKVISAVSVKCEITCDKYNDILSARIMNSDFWIYEETIRGNGKERKYRKLYVRGKDINAMSLHDELVKLFKDDKCLKIR